MHLTPSPLLERITINPDIMAGRPTIKGTRLTVEYILNLLGHGSTPEDILAEYQEQTLEDILACLLFAAKTLENIESEQFWDKVA